MGSQVHLFAPNMHMLSVSLCCELGPGSIPGWTNTQGLKITERRFCLCCNICIWLYLHCDYIKTIFVFWIFRSADAPKEEDSEANPPGTEESAASDSPAEAEKKV
jgi:hypothetical protein